jgi:hypothetical protein
MGRSVVGKGGRKSPRARAGCGARAQGERRAPGGTCRRAEAPLARGMILLRKDTPPEVTPEGGTAMSGKIALIVLIVATAVVVSVASSLAGMGDSGDHMGGGGVVRCSLDGINPVHHPEIFGNPAVAASYGFVRSRDGTWHVAPNCRR